MSNEKDKLIELLKDTLHEWECDVQFETISEIAEHLIENSVVVSPCKVGDTVWKIEDVWHLDDKASWAYHYEKEAIEFMVRSISISCNSKGVWTKKFRICQVENGKTIDWQRNIEFDDFGKTVFFTREEAEQALKEGVNNA